ncbi:MAG: hypothetical protein NVS1B14_02570 [Vulcanimicrobiaceae bacterium]
MSQSAFVSVAPFGLPIALVAAIYFFLLWHPETRNAHTDKRYVGPVFRSVHPMVAAQTAFALPWIWVALNIAHFYRHAHYPVFEGLALANAVPPALNICLFILGLMLLRLGRHNNPPQAPPFEQTLSTPQLQREHQHLKRKGQARLALLLGMILVQVILSPIIGAANGLFVAFALVAIVALVLHKVCDY